MKKTEKCLNYTQTRVHTLGGAAHCQRNSWWLIDKHKGSGQSTKETGQERDR